MVQDGSELYYNCGAFLIQQLQFQQYPEYPQSRPIPQQTPQYPQYPLYKERRIRKIPLIIGIILIVIGIVLALAIIPLTTKNVEQMRDDVDQSEPGWKSYEPGDKIQIYGEITGKDKYEWPNGEEVFGYFLDHDLRILSKEDIGNEGDLIIVNCEVKEISDPSVNDGQPFEYLEASSTVSPLLYYIPGIILIIIGVIIIILSLRKRK